MRLRAILLYGFCASSSADLLLPRPAGQFGTAVTTLGLVDHSRLDPFAPKPENRSTVISVFYPTLHKNDCNWSLIPAYPKLTAATFDAEVAFAGVPNGTFETVTMEVCPPQNRSAHACGNGRVHEAPIVFFSGGLGLSRYWYSALAQSVASYGFTVVTVDHPYDTDIVEFPDGRVLLAINSTWDEDQSQQDVDVRVEDVSFVLNELSKPTVVKALFPGRKIRLATDRVGIFGHSLGGATAAMAAYRDTRFVVGVNLDGGLYGPVIHEGLKTPFMLFGHKDNETTDTWPAIWPHLNWKLAINILNSTHTTFTDIPILAELIFGIPLPEFVQGIVGYLPATRGRDVIATYVVALMEMVLKCESQAILQRPSTAFPEIEFISGFED